MVKKDSKDVQVLIRVTPEQRERFKAAAAVEGFTLSEFLRRLGDVRAAEVLDCTHPRDRRRRYAWAEMCDKCNVRVREGDVWLIPEALR